MYKFRIRHESRSLNRLGISATHLLLQNLLICNARPANPAHLNFFFLLLHWFKGNCPDGVVLRCGQQQAEVIIFIQLQVPNLQIPVLPFRKHIEEKRKQVIALVLLLAFWQRQANSRKGWVCKIGIIITKHIFLWAHLREDASKLLVPIHISCPHKLNLLYSLIFGSYLLERICIFLPFCRCWCYHQQPSLKAVRSVIRSRDLIPGLAVPGT